MGIVRSIDDPKGRNRVLVECTSVFGKGEKNWAGWCEYFGYQVGHQKQGDLGAWCPPVPLMMVGFFFEGNNPKRPCCFPGPAWGDDGKPIIPLEAKNRGIKKALHMRVWKSESGHTLMWDDNGAEEAFYLVDHTGAGWFSMCPGKEEDEKPKGQCKESKNRKGKTRGIKMTFAGNTDGPQELKDGYAVIGHLDLNGQGVLEIAANGAGMVAFFASNKLGEMGPSLVLDANNNRAMLTAGKEQFIVDGKNHGLFGTRILIWERPFEDITQGLKKVLDKVKTFFEKYTKEQAA